MNHEEVQGKIVAFLSAEFARLEGRSCVYVDVTCVGDSIPLAAWVREEQPAMFEGLAKIEELAATMLTMADDHARVIGGSGQRIQFRIVTKQHLGARRQHLFTVESSTSVLAPGSIAESPDARGVLAQVMRHNELHMSASAGAFRLLLQSYERRVQDLERDNTRLRGEIEAKAQLLLDSKSNDERGQLEAMMMMSADERKGKIVSSITSMLPLVASYLAGGKGAAADVGSPLSLIVAKLAESISRDQVIAIMGVLSSEQQLLFMKAVELARAAEDAAAKKGPAAAQSSPPPNPQNGASSAPPAT